MKFRSGFLLAVVPLVAGISIATVITVGMVLERDARRRLDDELARSRVVFEDLQSYRQWVIRSQLRVVAEEPRLKAVAATEEISHETVLGVAGELKRALLSDLFLITDGDGRLLADTADPQAVGFDLKDKPLVASSLATGEGAGIWLADGEAFQVQGRRLAFGAQTVGVLVVGYKISERAAEVLHRQTASTVVVDLEGKPIVTAPKGVAVDAALLGAVPNGSGPVEVTLGGARHLAVASAWPGTRADQKLRCVILRSLDEALAPARRLTQFLYYMLAAALAAALALAVALAWRLSRPLGGLADFAAQLATGKLQKRVDVSGPEEVQSLARAMNKMAADLAESRKTLAAKEALEKEMEIAARIQTSILPQIIDVPGLEVSAKMLPASEVGGDYYDVIPVEDGAWIAIGDVAGHGLTAGLVMVMLQTAVSVLARRHPDLPPKEMVQALNAVLFENVRDRMANDEHVTLTLLRYKRGGKIVHAGAHEEILVCRATDGRVEHVPTPGTWLGVVRDLSTAIEDRALTLQKGDLMLLYTDGVTEAMNDAGEQLGHDRLESELHSVREKSVEEIRDHLLGVVGQWTRAARDDVSLVVVRERG